MELLKVKINNGGYRGEQSVISNIYFSVNKGNLVGMIGANGAGKSTTIKAMLGELPFIDGELTIHVNYSYIPERPIFYQELTLWEHFEFVAAVEELGESSLLYAKELLN